MAKLPKSFTADGPEMGTFDALPKDRYPMQVIESEVKPTKKAKEAKDPSLGQLAVFKWEVIAGEYKGRTVYNQINIVNENPQAVEIGNKELTSMCKALGLEGMEDTEETHGIPCYVELGVEEDAKGKYPDKNVFKKYEPYDDTPKAPPKKDKAKKKKKKKAPWE